MTVKTWKCEKGDNDLGAWEFVKENLTLDSSNKVFKVGILGKAPENMRLFVTNGGAVCKYKKGGRNYGYAISKITSLEWSHKSNEEKFNENIDKLLKHLKVDGLWTRLRTTLEIYKVLGYDECHKSYKASHRIYNEDKITFAEDYEKSRAYVVKILNILKEKEMWNVIQEFQKTFTLLSEDDITSAVKYGGYVAGDTSAMGYINEPDYRNVRYLFSDIEMVDNCKIKKMIFHKGRYDKRITDRMLNRIAEAMDNKESFHDGGFDNGYDVSFEYNAEKNRAWYSEEYKGCGNGHYYLALNRTHAVFYEND